MRARLYLMVTKAKGFVSADKSRKCYFFCTRHYARGRRTCARRYSSGPLGTCELLITAHSARIWDVSQVLMCV